jgi:hypothetical protein
MHVPPYWYFCMKKIVIVLSFLSFAASIEAQTIRINPLTNLTYCVGETGTVTYQSNGTFDTSNVFVVQLSTPGGSFSGWSIIGRGTASSGSIPVTFSQTGTYRLRVASTDPGAFSNDNGADINIAAMPVPSVVANDPWSLASLPIESSELSNFFVGVQDDSIHFGDENNSDVMHQWTFNQDANVASTSIASPSISWASGGQKTGDVRTWNSEGCTDTASFSLLIESCDPVIPKDALVVTGTEGGNIGDIWVKPGGAYSGNAVNVFVESGGEFSAPGSEVYQVFAKRGSSLIIPENAVVDIVVLDSGVSVSCNSFQGCHFLHCDSLQFDYSLLEPSGVQTSPPSNVTILQSGDHLFANDEGLQIETRISNILGAEVLSQHGSGSLDVDLSLLPAAVYFAVIDAGNDRQVKRIAVVH